MKLPTGSRTVLGSVLTPALLTFSHRASGKQSCIQTVGATFSDCPCDAAQFSFSVIRETSLEKNTVNLAVVVDGWESRDTLDGTWELEKDFAKSTAAAFADKKLFLNGGSASYVQYSNSTLATNSGTFYSLEEFESYVDSDDTVGGRTRVGAGIEQARSLLTAAPPASAAFMIVIIHAGGTMRFLPLLKEQADAARGEGVEVFAVGIGDFSSVGEGTLEEIGGNTDRVFQADNAQALSDVLDKILVESSTIACEATDATLEIEFGVPIAGVSHPTGVSFFDSVAILPIDDITSDGTDVAVQLETCMLANDITRVITEVSYSDNQGNELDISSLHDADGAKRCTTGSTQDNDSRSTWRKFVVTAKAAILVGGFATGIIVQLAWRPFAKLICVMIGMALFVWLSKAATVQKKKWRRADFEIVRRLGEGGFGCVFEAVERTTRTIYAMKVVDKRPLIVDETIKFLIAETKNQSCLRHENILRMDGYFENGVQAFIVLEFAPGGDLSTLPRSEMSDTRISSVLKQLADGLIHCHREGIIHRDVKPQNVLTGEDGKVKLADFRLSVQTDGQQVAGMCGTQGFMSPEMLEGLAYYFSTDIWSYGVLAYMLILWDMPTFHEGNIHWPADVYVNDEARDVLTRLLEFNPDRRLPLDQVETHPWIVMNSVH